MNKKIIITGGHATPAIAIINKIKKETNWEIVYLGEKFSFGDGKTISYEYKTIKKIKGVKFIPITTGKIQFPLDFNFFVRLLKIPLGLLQSFFLIAREKPNLIISFGGYLSTPAIIAGRLQKIPCLTHEQTSTVGAANRINAFFAKKIAITFPQSEKSLPKKKVVATGNMIREEILNPQPSRRLNFLKKEKKPIIYITGGKTGSLAVNRLILPLVPLLTKRFFLIHQTGALDKNISKKIGPNKFYFSSPFFSANEVGQILKHCRLVVSRAGANIVCELVLTEKPAILIPLENAKKNEQRKNALFLKSLGLAEVVNQNDSPQKLYKAIGKITNRPKNYFLKDRVVGLKLIDKNQSKFFRLIKKTIR